MSATDPQLNLVNSWDEAQAFTRWMEEPHDWLALDTETEGLDYWRDNLRLVQIGDTDTGWAIPWQGWGGLAKQAIENYPGPMVMHNSKFDLHFLEHNGIKVPRAQLHDTMAMVALLEPTLAKGLKPASERHVMKGAQAGDKLLQSAMAKNKWDWATVPIDLPEYWAYAALDTVLTAGLARKLYPQLVEKPAFRAYQYEVAVAQVLCDMERAGMLIDVVHTEKAHAWMAEREDILYEYFTRDLEISNPFSDRQLITWFEGQGYEFTKVTDNNNLALDGEVLDNIAMDRPDLEPVAEAVQDLRGFHKTKGTYFEAFLELADEDDRLHTSINPLGAVTGRMSSSRPNLQNVPSRQDGKLVRSSFIAAPGHTLISADFDQIEYRIMASRAGEKALIDAINSGQDLHTYMTSVVYNKPMEDVTPTERRIMKNATFGFLYGAGDGKFASMAGIRIDEARAFRSVYAEKFPGINSYAKEMTYLGQTHQAYTTEFLGRPQMVRPDDGGYKLLNYVTQGEAGDVLKKKLVELSMTEIGSSLRLPIHDEILFEVLEEEADHTVTIIQEIMPETSGFDVNLSVGVDVIKNWGAKY